MDRSDREKLTILLDHWIDHNKEHGGEFREWAGKAKGFGEGVVQKDMLDAAEHMDKASESLQRALEKLKKAES